MSQELQMSSGFNLAPKSLDEAMQYAKLIADSDLAPPQYKGKPGNVLVAVQMGNEIGLKPMQALQNIAVINNRPSIYGDAMLAIVKAHPKFEYINEWEENGIAYCEVKRIGEPAQTRQFSLEDAKRAGLKGKAGPWSTYESRMLQMRARGFALRDTFPDALKGLHLAEEAQDMPANNYVECRVVTSADELNKQLGVVIQETINYKDIFNQCSTADELKAEFDKHKTKVKSPAEITALITAKDQRKAEISTELAKAEIPAVEQTNKEWLEDFDKDNKPTKE